MSAPVFRRICVLGLGYVGLPTASLLGTLGYDVYGVDVNPQVVEKIRAGSIHIPEPGLDVLVKSAVQSGNLRVGTEPEEADVFILAVPTPFEDGHQPDLSFVTAATDALVPVIRAGNLVVLESTCPVGTTKEIVAPRLAASGLTLGEDLFVAHCPERVLPGKILSELLELDRIVGGVDEASAERAQAFFAGFVNGEVHCTTAETAELTKLVENAYRDVNIALANELSLICDVEGVSVGELIQLANRHPRVNILQPGPGVGGHCIAVDPWFIIARQPTLTRLLAAARAVNDQKPDWVVERVKRHAEKFVRPVIACLGLAYKADVNDLRESPALKIVRSLISDRVGEVLAVEPNLERHADFSLHLPEEAINVADIVVILVGHKEFRKIKRERFHEKIVIDTVGMLV